MLEKALEKQQVAQNNNNSTAEISDNLSSALVDFLGDDWLNKIQSLDVPANIE